MIRSIYRAAIGLAPIVVMALAGCQADISISVQPISPLPASGVTTAASTVIPAQETSLQPPEIVVPTATQETLAPPPEITVVTATQETLALPPEIVVVTATQETLAEVVASDALLTFTDQTALQQ
jgi:hypothetical protein